MSKRKLILVTGGAGYIGSHTIIDLIENSDFDIISADNFCNSSEATFDRIEKITGKKINNYNIDLTDYKLTRSIFSKNKIDGIIHFAALKSVPESVEKPEVYHFNNLKSLENLLQLSVKYGVKNFIFSSSCSVYGNIKELPVSETTPLNPVASPYAETKLLGEQLIEKYAESNVLKTISLRYFNPVGAHMSGLNGEDCKKLTNLVPIICKTAIGKNDVLTIYGDNYETRDGTCIRDYIHVSDIAHAHILALKVLFNKEEDVSYYDVINLGSGEGVSVLELVDAFEKSTGITVNKQIGPKRPGDVEAIYSDCTKSKEILGWKAKYSIEDMMTSAWKWENYLAKISDDTSLLLK